MSQIIARLESTYNHKLRQMEQEQLRTPRIDLMMEPKREDGIDTLHAKH